MYPSLREQPFAQAFSVWTGRLPDALLPDPLALRRLWDLHPSGFHVILMHGRPVPTPRWQQAYGADYRYTGRVNRALPVPPDLAPFLAWAQGIDPRLNGLLLNWYAGDQGHYIGPHRDSTSGMIRGCPILTLSLGATRIFRMRVVRPDPYDTPDAPAPDPGAPDPAAPACHDFPVDHGSVILIPWATNARCTHEVPRHRRLGGDRISITFRGFTG